MSTHKNLLEDSLLLELIFLCSLCSIFLDGDANMYEDLRKWSKLPVQENL